MSNESDFVMITEALQAGGIAVVRTDTIYGVIALASNERAVEKVYAAKHRSPEKQCIVLIADPQDVPVYAEHLDTYGRQAELPTSVIVPATTEPSWLLRGGNTIAYRVVRDPFLKRVVEEVGPVIAPSANPEGETPAASIEEARRYFGDTVDVYIDGGVVPKTVHASQIIYVNLDGSVDFIRS